jgi:branched-chain amino acid transport system permease protein
MNLSQAVQYCLSGITVGSVYAITAIGFNIIYSTTGIINFAQGEFLIVGAMTAISLSHFVPLPLAIALAVLITTLLGGLIEVVFLRSVKNATVLQLVVATIGLSILIREAMLHIWDEKVRSMPYFTGTAVSNVSLLGAHISLQVLWVLGVCAVIVVVLTIFFRFTVTGWAMRACADDWMAARLCGIKARQMVTLSFMLSAAIGALAGCVIAPVTQAQYDMGSPLAIKGFTVAILGGLGNSMGAIAAGLLLGVLEALVTSQIPVAYTEVVAIAVLLLVLVFRPSGLFSRGDISALRAV